MVIQILSTANAAKPSGNPTDGSPWIIQILSMAALITLLNAMDGVDGIWEGPELLVSRRIFTVQPTADLRDATFE